MNDVGAGGVYSVPQNRGAIYAAQEVSKLLSSIQGKHQRRKQPPRDLRNIRPLK